MLMVEKPNGSVQLGTAGLPPWVEAAIYAYLDGLGPLPAGYGIGEVRI